MHLLRRFHAGAEVGPVGIVGINGLLDQYVQFGRGPALVDQELLFEDAVNPFSQSILIAVISIGH